MDGYQELAIAIVVQAAKDYRSTLKEMKRHPEMKALKRRAERIEAFIRSDWCHTLIGADGESIITRLKKEVEE